MKRICPTIFQRFQKNLELLSLVFLFLYFINIFFKFWALHPGTPKALVGALEVSGEGLSEVDTVMDGVGW
jgi:hypothetical protein